MGMEVSAACSQEIDPRHCPEPGCGCQARSGWGYSAATKKGSDSSIAVFVPVVARLAGL
jgi:hypothetical protein